MAVASLLAPLRYNLVRVGFCLSIAAILTSCQGAAIEANQRQVQANQQQIEDMQREIARLKAEGAAPSPTAPPIPSSSSISGTSSNSGCDRAVTEKANRKAGDAFAAGDLKKALAYYNDALTACPGDPRAEMNVARTNESLGNRDTAIEHYRAVAKSSDSGAASDARTALSRMGVAP